MGHHAAHGVAGAVDAALIHLGIDCDQLVQQVLGIHHVGVAQLRVLHLPQRAVGGGVGLAAAQGGGHRHQGGLGEHQHDALLIGDIVPQGILKEIAHRGGGSVIGNDHGQLLAAAAVSLRDIDQILPVDALGVGEASELHSHLLIVHLPGDSVGQHTAAVAVELAHEVPDHVGGGRQGVVIVPLFGDHGGRQDLAAFRSKALHGVLVVGCGLPVVRHSLCLLRHGAFHDLDGHRHLLAGDAVGLGIGIKGHIPVGRHVAGVNEAGIQEHRSGDIQGILHGVLLQAGTHGTVAHQVHAGTGLEPLARLGGADAGIDVCLLLLQSSPGSTLGGFQHEQAKALLVRLVHPAAGLHEAHGVQALRDVHHHEHGALGRALGHIELGGAGGIAHLDVHFQHALPQHGHHVVLGLILGCLLGHQALQL